jgi:hypothetical protein
MELPHLSISRYHRPTKRGLKQLYVVPLGEVKATPNTGPDEEGIACQKRKTPRKSGAFLLALVDAAGLGCAGLAQRLPTAFHHNI